MKKVIFIFLLSAILAGVGHAAEIMTYQGRLKESGAPVTGNRNFSFEFCANSDGTSCTASPDVDKPFQVVNGLFKSTFTIPAVNLSAGPWYLRVKVSGSYLAPVERLTHVPYALQASSASYASALSVASGWGVMSSTHIIVTGGISAGDWLVSPSTEAVILAAGKLTDRANGIEDVRVAVMGYTRSDSTDANDIAAGGNFEAEIPVGKQGNMFGLRAVNRNYGTSANAIGVMIDALQNTGTINNTYAIWIATMTAGTQSNKPYALYSEDDKALTYFAGNVGISSRTPAYALVVSSASGPLLWVAQDGAHATKFIGDGSGLTGVTGASGTDNSKVLKIGDTMTGALTLSSMTATSPLGVGAAQLLLRDNVYVSSEANAALGGGMRVSSHVYVVGFSSAAKYYGDGSSLTGVIGTDNSRVSKNGDTMLGALTLANSSMTVTGKDATSGYSLWLSSGINMPAGVVNAALFIGSGTVLTDLNATNLNKGTVHEARLPANVSLLGSTQTITAARIHTSSITVTNPLGIGTPHMRLFNNVWISSETNPSLGGGMSVSSNVYVVGFSSAAKYYGDGSALTGVIGSSMAAGSVYNDAIVGMASSKLIGSVLDANLSSNVALLNANQTVTNIKTHTSSITVTSPLGIGAPQVRFFDNVLISSEANPSLGGGVRVSSNVYVVGFSSAAKYYGDASSLTNVPGDNMGSHIATTNLQMAGKDIVAVSTISVSSITAVGAGVTFSTNVLVMNGKIGVGTVSPDGMISIVANPGANEIEFPSSGSNIQIMATGTPGQFQIGGGTDFTVKVGASNGLVIDGNSNVTVSTLSASGSLNAAHYQIAGSTVLAILPGLSSLGLGLSAGMVNIGNFNSFLGSYAGYANTVGANNSFTGYHAGNLNASGSNNSFFGSQAGENNTFGSNSALLGYRAAYYNQVGSANAIFGSEAGSGVGGSFSSSTIVGYRAGYGLSTGSDNILLGWKAGYTVSSGTGNIVIGYEKTTSAPGANNELNIGGVLFGDLSSRSIGISTRVPQAALDIVSTGTAADLVQIWRDGSGNIVSSMSATGIVMATKFVGNASGLFGIPGDNLGVHVATTTLNMAGFQINGVSTITTAGGSVIIRRYAPNETGDNNYAVSIGSGAYDNHDTGLGIGYSVYSNYNSGVGIGSFAHTNRDNGVGIGASANTNYDYGVGIGYGANNNYTYGLGVGMNANFNRTYGVGLGKGAYNNNDYGVGIGSDASLNYNYGVGVGAGSQNNYNYGTGVGAYTSSKSSSVALGYYAKALNVEAIALGAGAQSSAKRSVCIGAYCVNNATDTVKVREGYTLKVDSITISGNNASLMISTNMYIVGYSSAARYFGDGSGITGITATDNSKLPLTGGTVTGPLTLSSAFSVGASTLVVTGGRVGVGTNSPSEMFDVSGRVQISTAAGGNTATDGLFSSGTNGMMFANNGSTYMRVANGKVAMGSSVTVGASKANLQVPSNLSVGSSFASQDVPANGLIVEGSVGVGTSSPTALLEVRDLTASSAYVLKVGTGTSTTLVVTTNGIVGVGTIFPSSNTVFHAHAEAVSKTPGEDVTLGLLGSVRATGTDLNDAAAGGDFQATTEGTVNLGYLVGLHTELSWENSTGGIVSKAAQLYLGEMRKPNFLGIVTDTYGILISTLTAPNQTNAPYAIYSEDPNARTYFAGKVGISSATPQYALVVSSAAGSSDVMLVVSTGTEIVFGVKGNGEVFAGDIHASKYYGDGSGLTSVSGDSLGTHVATTTLQMGAYGVNSSSSVTASSYQIYGSTVLAIFPGKTSLAVGVDAGRGNTGNYSVFVGSAAGNLNSGDSNNFIGYLAGYSNTTGNQNNFVGRDAGRNNISGQNNTFVGNNAGWGNVSGSENSYFGDNSGYNNASGRYNSVFGNSAGSGASASYSSTTLVGHSAGIALTTGHSNTLIGYNAGYDVTTGTGNIVIGVNQAASNNAYNNRLNVGGVLFGDLSAKTIGISTRVPQAALDILSTGTASNYYAQIWRDSAGVVVGSMTSMGTMSAIQFSGNGAGLTGVTGNDPNKVSKFGDTMTGMFSIAGGTLSINNNLPSGHSMGFMVLADGTIISTGSYPGIGALPVSGSGDRFMWIPGKGAIRAGGTTGTNWDYSSIGAYSVAFGYNNIATSNYPTAVGGYGNSATGSLMPFVGGGNNNAAAGDYTAVVGGKDNKAFGDVSFIGAGSYNIASGSNSVISGGGYNLVQGTSAVVAGGEYNQATGKYSTVAGGLNNQASETYSVVTGGIGNRAQGFFSIIGGGYMNTVEYGGMSNAIFSGEQHVIQSNNWSSFIGGGSGNYVNSGASYGVVAGGYHNYLYNNAEYSVIAGGKDNHINNSSVYSAVLGGVNNQVYGSSSAVAGGGNNVAASTAVFIGGGYFNTVSGNNGVIVGGTVNNNFGASAFIGGGSYHTIDAPYGVITGGNSNKVGPFATGGFIGGGYSNISTAAYSTIGGGFMNISSGTYSAVLGGYQNVVSSQGAVVVGGERNWADGNNAFIGGGFSNYASSYYSFIGGGTNNTASGQNSGVVGGASNKVMGNEGFIGGGMSNSVFGQYGVISGGSNNEASGLNSSVPGGAQNSARGMYSFAAGYRSTAAANGAFTWNDSFGDSITNIMPNQVMFKASGGFWVSTSSVYSAPALFVNPANQVGIGTLSPQSRLQVAGDVGLGDGNELNNQPVVIWLKAFVSVNAGDVVVAGSGAGENQFTTTALFASTGVIGVALDNIPPAAVGKIAIGGVVTVNCAGGGVGMHAVTNTTAGQVAGVPSPASGANLGVFLTNCGSIAANKARLLLR